MNKMRVLKIVLCILFLGSTWSCSWVQYFMIVNESEQPIEVTYSLKSADFSIPIFLQTPKAYQLKKHGQLNWDTILYFADLDSTPETIRMIIPINTALIFGNLYNSNYTTYKQQMESGVKYNLENMTVKTIEETIEIIPETFDCFFHKQKGNIVLVMK